MALAPIILPAPKLTFGNQATLLNARRKSLDNERSTYLEEWVDIADYFRVRRSRAMTNGSTAEARKRSRSKKWLNEKGIFNSRILGAGMLSGVSSPSRPWLRVGTADSDLNEYKSVKLWFDIVQKRLYQAFAMSNYYQTKQQSYQDMGDFGQGPVLIDEDYDSAINTYCSPVGEYYMSINYKGLVDTLYRDLAKTTLQLMQQFGTKVPTEVRMAYDRSDYDQMWLLVHAVEPNLKRIAGAQGPMGMVFSSVYWMPGTSDANDNSIVEVKGYWDNPISAPRWDVQANDVYGDGPGAIALPGNKSLQALEKRTGQIVDKLAVPPLQAPSSMRTETVSHVNGQVTYYPAAQNGQQPIGPLYKTEPNALQAVGEQGMRQESRQDKAYFVDLFQATLDSDRRQVTAAEIAERHEEKLIALGPTLERTHFEGLDIDVKRTFGILARNHILPPPPPELNRQPIKITYTSLLAVAQRAIGLTGIERFAGFVGSIAATQPQVMDKWDLDQTVDEYGEQSGVPAAIVRSDEEVRVIRDQRNKDAQRQQQLAQVAAGAQAAKVASEADTGRGSNLLADIIGNQGRIV